jgi:hypothetical protein
MAKQILNEEFLRMQQLAGIIAEEVLNENIESITWNWAKARSTSENDEGVVYKVWGANELYNYYGEFFLSHDKNDDRNDIEDKKIRKKFGEFRYIEKWTKDTEEFVDEIDNPEDYPVK